MFRSTSLRLAAIYTAGFAVAVGLMGLVTVVATRAALAEQFDSRIRAEMAAIMADYYNRGMKGLVGEIDERKGNPGELGFGLLGPGGRPLNGALINLHPRSGWSTVQVPSSGGSRTLRLLTQELPGGARLILGDDMAGMSGLERSIQNSFIVAFAAVMILGAAGGFALSKAVQRRLQAIFGTAEAIIDGDLGRRVPVSGGGDDLARLAQTLNRMLDRITGLMDSLRHVSSDVAHDLRTPLNRLRQRLEQSLRQATDPLYRAQIEGALGDIDAILITFAAILRIAEVEAGARRASFRRFDLTALTYGVVEDFAPAAEDAAQTLTYSHSEPAFIDGDPDLITQMVVNLVENAIRHTRAGARIDVCVKSAEGGVVMMVRDDGPGVPESERERLFDRFYRLERSRSSPGSGLGLSLVAAIARLHRADLLMADAHPGLEVRARFPAP